MKYNIPISILCKDRPHYLDLTLKSLTATLPPEVRVCLFDDCSSNEQMVRYLETNDCFDASLTGSFEAAFDKGNFHARRNFGFPLNNSEWDRHVGSDLQINKRMCGIKDKVTIYKLLRAKGDLNNTLFSIRTAFEQNHNVQAVLRIEDDVVFKRRWYHTMLETFAELRENNSRFCILAGATIFDRVLPSYFHDPTRADGFPYEANVYCREMILQRSKKKVCVLNLNKGFTAQALMISRDLYDVARPFFLKNYPDIRGGDKFLCDLAHNHGKLAACLSEGVCQHIGYKGIAGKKGKRGKVRIDRTVFPPYEISKIVRNFKMEQA